MGRSRIHKDNAARQKAYRQRLAATQARQGAGVTSAQRAMTERVARTVEKLAPEIDTSALR